MTSPSYQPEAMTREQVDAMQEPVLLVFGVDWCPHCQAAEAPLEQAIAAHPALKMVKIEDGKGRALGRSFSVKLWPTLILIRAGQEIGRVVRPTEAKPIEALIATI